ncbi:hypothetical protein V2J09_010144 [Rumex salicifolius]
MSPHTVFYLLIWASPNLPLFRTSDDQRRFLLYVERFKLSGRDSVIIADNDYFDWRYEMTVKGEIAEYREKLDKTLASNDLTDEETLRNLVKDHILRSTEHDNQESIEYVINKRTSELSNFLGMLRSTSEGNEGIPQKTSHPTWKVKQDTDEIRVMYREGPEGSPYHSLLAEGYVDAPVDACLCISVEVALYPTWFPETKVPTFKIILAQCLRRIRIGENISLVRMKLSWPLSNREALIHFYEFEYLKDGLVIVMTHTPDLESIQKEIHDFSDDQVSEAGQTVRVGVIGGFALQKVTEERSYFRTIASMDVKLDFVPPWLINFMSRQLIGTGFKLYKKILTTKSKDDENITKALNDPLYIRIRKALYPDAELKRIASLMIDEGDTVAIPQEQANLIELDDKEVSENEHGSDSSESLPEYIASSDWKPSNEIEEEVQEIKNTEEYQQTTENGGININYSPKEDYTTDANFDHKNVRLSPQVQKALGTLDKAISMVREARTKSQTVSPARFSTEGSPKLEISEARLMAMEDYEGLHLNTAPAPLTPPKAERMNRTPQKHSNGSSIRSVRLNPPAKEVNPNSLTPASPELILSSSNASPKVTPSNLIQNGFMENPNSNISTNGKHEDKTSESKKTGQHKKWRMCCLNLVSGRLVS